MNLKSKIFGLAATTVLALSITTGAMAQSTVNGSVTLAEGLCSMSVSQSNSDFGTWNYDGVQGKYIRGVGNNVIMVSGTIYPSMPNGVCDLAVATSGLTNGSAVIPASHFDGSADSINWYNLDSDLGVNLPINAPGMVFEDVAAGPGAVYLRLNDVPDNYAPDEYAGTVTLTVSNPNQ